MAIELLIQLFVSGIGMGFIFALIAIGLTLIYGVMDVINFAHGEFLMVSMYAAYLIWVMWGLDPIVTVPLVAGIMFLFGIGVYHLLIKHVLGKSHHAQIFSTFGLMAFLQALAQFVAGADYRAIQTSSVSGVIEIGGITLPGPQLAACAGACIATTLLYLLVFRTRTGQQLRAASQDPVAASTLGINGGKMYSLAWGLAAACVCVAGSLLSCFYPVFPRVGGAFVLVAYVVVALGGFGSVHGALLGGLLIGVMQAAAGFFISSQLKFVPVYAMYLLVVLFRPRGLFGRS